ncbi:MAG: DNA polymerase III subunit beta [Firmicutes bacterium HGW-Firmicutes-12]|jgi:DNA polymerase-3 subunit beta|nr:MAG: DNA polymerase III subunit beta [Firmicutes bacterium HGW-Firmicutes-12]
MRITATKDNLVLGVTAVQKAVSSKTALPILSCIRIEAKDNFLYFTGTDLDIGIQCYVPVDIISEGIAIVTARHFSEIVRRLPDVPIEIHHNNENEITIKYEDSQLVIKTLQDNDYPNFPEVIGENKIQVKAAVLRNMIKQTTFAAGNDEGRPLFTGILFEYEEKIIRLIATDTHRLALRQGTVENNITETGSCIIPAKILNELARLMHDDDDICLINITKNLISFKIANILIISRLLEGQFPNYRQVIPNKYNLKIKTRSKKFQESVERISLFTALNDNSNTLQIQINENMLVISSQSELGQGYEQLSIDAVGEPVNIAFNARYLLDAFKVIDADIISIEFTGPLSPCIIRPAESENFICLLLPVRT